MGVRPSSAAGEHRDEESVVHNGEKPVTIGSSNELHSKSIAVNALWLAVAMWMLKL